MTDLVGLHVRPEVEAQAAGRFQHASAIPRGHRSVDHGGRSGHFRQSLADELTFHGSL